MTVLTITPDAHEQLAPLGRDDAPLAVVALCAAWCNTCAEFRPMLERIAAERAAITFVWIDIEDDAELCGDLDVENFPTLLAFRGQRLLHYGVTLPVPAVAARLIDELATRVDPAAGTPPPAAALRDALLALGRSA